MEVPIVHSALIGQRLEFAEDYNAAKKNYWKVCVTAHRQAGREGGRQERRLGAWWTRSEAVMTTVVCAGGQHGELPVGGVAGGERWPNPLMLFTGTRRSHISACLDGCRGMSGTHS